MCMIGTKGLLKATTTTKTYIKHPSNECVIFVTFKRAAIVSFMKTNGIFPFMEAIDSPYVIGPTETKLVLIT